MPLAVGSLPSFPLKEATKIKQRGPKKHIEFLLH
jgi:hypothetical protein